jgi:type II secretory pathway pseudopilin PulG
MIRQRQGFALMVVLWVMVGIGILALAVALAGRNALATASNRTALTSARWRAEGCAERVRAASNAALTEVHPDAVIAVWDSLDRVIATSPLMTNTSCTIISRAVGSALDINTADATELSRLFAALHIGPARADSLTDALLDWRDADTLPRPLGAERSWYIAAHRLVPRDSAFADIRELLLVRGFEHFGDTLNVFGTEIGRLALAHAPLPVLASLPGFTVEALTRVSDLRAHHQRLPELIALSATLPKDARETLIAHYAELTRGTTPEPEGWIVTVSVKEGTPQVTSTLELYLARAGTRVAVLRRR